jgi:SAM-dependent methyltransferase
VGLQSWASSIVLAGMMCAAPGEFGLHSHGLRVLELGAGTGLLSIVVGKLLPPNDDGASPTIVATDYHPDVLRNLASNIGTNFSTPPVDVHAFDWEYPLYSVPLDAPFDVILAADVVYHPDHAQWIRGCVEQLLCRPAHSRSGGVFWLMIPVRSAGRHGRIHGTVEDVFPYVGDGGEDAGAEWGLVVLEKVEVGKQGIVGRADENGYELFKIGWGRCC